MVGPCHGEGAIFVVKAVIIAKLGNVVPGGQIYRGVRPSGPVSEASFQIAHCPELVRLRYPEAKSGVHAELAPFCLQ